MSAENGKIKGRVTFKEHLFQFLDQTLPFHPNFKTQMELFCNVFGREKIETYYRDWKEARGQASKPSPPVAQSQGPELGAPESPSAEPEGKKGKPYGSYWWHD